MNVLASPSWCWLWPARKQNAAGADWFNWQMNLHNLQSSLYIATAPNHTQLKLAYNTPRQLCTVCFPTFTQSTILHRHKILYHTADSCQLCPSKVHFCKAVQCMYIVHSLIITREGLILTLSICSILQGCILRASLHAGKDWPILSLEAGLINPLPRGKIEHPSSRDEHTAGDSVLMRQCTV